MSKFINPFTDVGFKRIFGQEINKDLLLDLQRLPFQARKSVFQKLEEVVTLASLSKDEREKYDESLKVLRDRISELAYAEQKGVEKGKLEVAMNLKQAGYAPETIAQLTGLSLEVVAGL